MKADISFILIAGPLCSFVVTFFVTWWLIKGSVPKILDYPNYRSLHSEPISRMGGIGLMLGVLVTWISFNVDLPLFVWIGASLLALISFVDDIFGLPVWTRLLIHGLVACGFSVTWLFGGYDWLIVFIITVSIVWVSNLYNFMDGSDGLAGGMTIIGFGYYGLAALLVGDHDFAIVNFSVSAAATAFLIYNFFPARIFMGDVGSIPLGFLAAVLGVVGWEKGLWTLWFPLLVFSPFFADSTVTLIKRILQGKKVWLAHCEHYYQRAVQSSLGHRNTALLGYVLMLLVGASALWVSRYDLTTQNWVGVVWGCIYLMLMLAADWLQPHRVDSE